jgi:hypothetical protein
MRDVAAFTGRAAEGPNCPATVAAFGHRHQARCNCPMGLAPVLSCGCRATNSKGAAIAIEEYVPTNMPNRRTNVKP